MLRSWIELLPLFVVRRIAAGQCERLPLASHVVVQPRADVLFIVPKPPASPSTGETP